MISSVTTPIKVLMEFEKVEIEPSETILVNFEIPINDLGLWDKNMDYIVEPGAFDFMIGSSSEDIRLKKSIVLY